MYPTPASESSRPMIAHAAAAREPELSLGELVELVASIVPEAEVADTVAALFADGVASFAHLLDREELAALRKVS